MAGIAVVPLDAGRLGDFYRIHCPSQGEGWCNCVAWWVPTWEGWGQRTAEENRSLRNALFAEGHYDGFLLYRDGEPAGWCQCGPRDRLGKLVAQYRLDPDPEMWAFTCFVVAPGVRGQGLAHHLLAGALEHLEARGVRRVQAYPRRTGTREPGEAWTGPETLFVAAGFELERDDPRFPVYLKRLRPG